MYVSHGLADNVNPRVAFFDADGNKTRFRRMDYQDYKDAVLPEHFEQMKKESEKLAKDIPFVRVDWFEENGRIYFSEMTFTPCGCMMKIAPKEYDLILGRMLDIREIMHIRK